MKSALEILENEMSVPAHNVPQSETRWYYLETAEKELIAIAMHKYAMEIVRHYQEELMEGLKKGLEID